MTNLAELESLLFQQSKLSRYLRSLNRNQMQNLSGEIFAKLYWRKRNPDWYKDESNRVFARLRWVKRIIKKRLNTGNVASELSEHGSVMERFNVPCGDYMEFASRFLRQSGWKAIVRESAWSACWANEDELKLCTFCEGDVVVMQAPDKAAFIKDRDDLLQWYAENK